MNDSIILSQPPRQPTNQTILSLKSQLLNLLNCRFNTVNIQYTRAFMSLIDLKGTENEEQCRIMTQNVIC